MSGNTPFPNESMAFETIKFITSINSANSPRREKKITNIDINLIQSRARHLLFM